MVSTAMAILCNAVVVVRGMDGLDVEARMLVSGSEERRQKS